MCNVTRETKMKSVTGWKVVGVDKNGHYYSLFTGYLYFNGKRQQAPSGNKLTGLLPTNFSSGMNGRTGVFNYKKDARETLKVLDTQLLYYGLTEKVKFKIIKATISEEIAVGVVRWSWWSDTLLCYIGRILSWEE